jgi:hypothetical protein
MGENSKSFLSAGFLRMKSSLLLATICLFCAIGTAASAEEPPLVNMLIDVVAWGDEIPGLHLGTLGSKEDAIHALSFRYGREPVRYSGPRQLAVYRSLGDAQGEAVFTGAPQGRVVGGSSSGQVPQTLAERRLLEPNLVALVELPRNALRATLLLSPAGDGTYKSYIINDDPSRLPAGKLLVHNLSPHTIAMQFSSNKPVFLQPREQFLFEDSEKYLPYRLAYQLKYQPEEADDWKVQGSNIMKLSSDEQTQMIILQSDNDFFRSSSGARSGYLQTVILRRRME